MDIYKNMKIVLLLVITLFTLSLEANPVFARQYGMACSGCHTQVPALNDMGLCFLRNGFKTHKGDFTALESLLDLNSTSRSYPIGAIVGLSADSDGGEVGKSVKLYLAGSITDSFSVTANTKETFKDSNNEQKLFSSDNSSFYFQYNPQEVQHVFRAGILSPFTMLGNVQRSTAGAGLNFDTESGSDKYRTPLGNADTKKIKGAEYSYKSSNNILFLASYGEVMNNSGSGNNAFDDEEYSFLGALKYISESNYRIGLIYSTTDNDTDSQYSLILPIQKEYPLLIWNTSLVYVNNEVDSDYFGIENAFTFPLRDMEHIKVVVNADKDENKNNNYGYSIGYSKIYEMFFFTLNAAHIDTETFSDNQVSGSISIIF